MATIPNPLPKVEKEHLDEFEQFLIAEAEERGLVAYAHPHNPRHIETAKGSREFWSWVLEDPLTKKARVISLDALDLAYFVPASEGGLYDCLTDKLRDHAVFVVKE